MAKPTKKQIWVFMLAVLFAWSSSISMGANTPVFLSGNVPEATQLAFDLRENYNIFCSIVAYPVIPKGHIIYRLIPTAEHTQEEIDLTLKAFSETKAKLDAGAYKSEEIPDMANK